MSLAGAAGRVERPGCRSTLTTRIPPRAAGLATRPLGSVTRVTAPDLEIGTGRDDVETAGTSARPWWARRHGLGVELLLVVAVYVAYDTSRGLVAGGARLAVEHGRAIERLEAIAHVDIERGLQHAAAAVPGLLVAFAFGYASLHLLATGATLLWLHRRNADAYVRMRSTVLLASLVSLVGFDLWPTAPPRLDRLGIADSVTRAGLPMDAHPLLLLYNPYAAFPSLHEAYAVAVGFALWRYARSRRVRALGIGYPVLVAVEVVATGNHFVLDVLAGAAAVAVSLAVTDRALAAALRTNRPPGPARPCDPTPARSSRG
jgi:membrane-associated phospholipid phosphatase